MNKPVSLFYKLGPGHPDPIINELSMAMGKILKVCHCPLIMYPDRMEQEHRGGCKEAIEEIQKKVDERVERIRIGERVERMTNDMPKTAMQQLKIDRETV